MSLLTPSALAQGVQDAQNAGPFGALGPYAQVLPLIPIFLIFYFLLMRPQQQRQKQLKATVAALKRGDRIVTAGGILGVVQRAREGATEIEVEIASGVRVTVLRDTIASVVADIPVAANDSVPERRKS